METIYLGNIVEDPSKATHVISKSTTESTETVADEEWYRTLEKKGNMVSLHWWYYPDSYDKWVESRPEFADPEPPPDHSGSWKVSERWLRDSVKFNEWMNEEDYEVSSTNSPDRKAVIKDSITSTHNSNDNHGSVPNSPLKTNSQLPPSTATISAPTTTVPTTKPSTSTTTTGPTLPHGTNAFSGGDDPNPIVKAVDLEDNGGHRTLLQHRKNDADSKANIQIQNISHTEMDGGEKINTSSTTNTTSDAMDVDSSSAPGHGNESIIHQNAVQSSSSQQKESGSNDQTNPLEGDAMKTDAPPTKHEIPAEANPKRHWPQQTQEIIIPSYAAWFSFDKIADVEKKALPEFFNNRNKSKTPTVYKDYRDFMINTYRMNPLEYLTVTACRRNLAGDVCAIIRVHAFLEQWGLINYQVRIIVFLYLLIP